MWAGFLQERLEDGLGQKVSGERAGRWGDQCMHEPGGEHLRTGTSWVFLEQKGSEGGVGRVSERSGG